MHLVESGLGLEEHVDILALVEEDDVIQSVVVHIDESDGTSTVEGAIELVGGDGEGLGERKGADGHEGRQQEKAGLVHP